MDLVKPQRLGDIYLATFEDVIRVNLYAAVQGTHATLAGMKDRGWGRIINISSLTVLGSVERTAYAAAKASLISFTRNWALELAQTGITVNAVAPGPTETELFRANNPSGSAGEERYPRGSTNKAIWQAKRDCGYSSFSDVTGRRLYNRPDPLCRWRVISGPLALLTRQS